MPSPDAPWTCEKTMSHWLPGTLSPVPREPIILYVCPKVAPWNTQNVWIKYQVRQKMWFTLLMASQLHQPAGRVQRYCLFCVNIQWWECFRRWVDRWNIVIGGWGLSMLWITVNKTYAKAKTNNLSCSLSVLESGFGQCELMTLTNTESKNVYLCIIKITKDWKYFSPWWKCENHEFIPQISFPLHEQMAKN